MRIDAGSICHADPIRSILLQSCLTIRWRLKEGFCYPIKGTDVPLGFDRSCQFGPPSTPTPFISMYQHRGSLTQYDKPIEQIKPTLPPTRSIRSWKPALAGRPLVIPAVGMAQLRSRGVAKFKVDNAKYTFLSAPDQGLTPKFAQTRPCSDLSIES